MAVVTELQAELLAALLNSGVSSETIIQALKVGEKPSSKPPPSHVDSNSSSAKLEKVVNGGRAEMDISSVYMSAPSDAAIGGATGQHDSLPASPMSELGTNTQSIAEQLMRSDPWHSAKIIKQYMQQHNIPQREAVETTGLNQSHLSQHLNKGTPMKTQKRMTLYKWFEAKQREVAAQYNSTSGKRLSDHDMGSPHFGNSSYKRPRRNRFKWGQASTEILYQAYETQRNPSKDEREALVQGCNRAECEQRGIPLEQVNNLGPNLVTESRVYNWFANRRKEEAFKVKLAMDAGTYSVAVVAPPGNTDMVTTPDSKLTSTSDKLPIPISTRSLQPMLVTPNRSGDSDTTSPRTPLPVPRLPTMSLIKCEQSPTSTQIPPVSQLTPSSQSTVLQRPISVAFGTMPPQILTPTQLQVITGIMPGQVVPISSANVSQAPNDVGSLPPGQVTNLMLPGQLGAQPIHAVTLMSMSGGTSQVFYSVPGQSVPLSLANSTTLASQTPMQLPGSITTPTPVQIIPQGVVTSPSSVALNTQANMSAVPQNLLGTQHLPLITSVQGASNQIGNSMMNMVLPLVSGTSLGQSQPSSASRSDTAARLPPMQLSQLGSPVSTTIQQAAVSKESKQSVSEVPLVRHMKREDSMEKPELAVTNGDKSVTNNSFADDGVVAIDNEATDATVTSVDSGT